jgi:hypothetical protein
MSNVLVLVLVLALIISGCHHHQIGGAGAGAGASTTRPIVVDRSQIEIWARALKKCRRERITTEEKHSIQMDIARLRCEASLKKAVLRNAILRKKSEIHRTRLIFFVCLSTVASVSFVMLALASAI